jgi:hypothetical protein
MSRRAISRVILIGLVFVTATCSKPSSPGGTQAGAASDTWRNGQKLGDEAKAAGY